MSSRPDPSYSEQADALLENLDGVIAYMEATAEEAWRVDTVRSKDGSTNCFFGHLFNMGGSDELGSALWHAFEERWATTYVIYGINDGTHPDYPQPTPKQRVLAYLRNLRDGKELDTIASMEEEFRYWEAIRAKEAAA